MVSWTTAIKELFSSVSRSYCWLISGSVCRVADVCWGFASCGMRCSSWSIEGSCCLYRQCLALLIDCPTWTNQIKITCW